MKLYRVESTLAIGTRYIQADFFGEVEKKFNEYWNKEDKFFATIISITLIGEVLDY